MGHGGDVVEHFLFVVYSVERGVDGFVEASSALFAEVALDGAACAVFADGVAAAAGAAESGMAGGEGCSFFKIHW